MKIMALPLLLSLVCLTRPTTAQTTGGTTTVQAAPSTTTASNEALKAVVARDQAIRTATSIKQDTHETDADRRVIVRKMIDAGELHTGLDYRNASLVMQHGTQPDDYLLAHALAVIGASKGDKTALWLSAATLDRYLKSIKQPQVYGTQYSRPSVQVPFTQEPYNRTLLTDGLRQATEVLTIEEQSKQTDEFNKTVNK